MSSKFTGPATWEFFKYAAASGAALMVDVAVLTFLVSGAGWSYLLAATVSFVAGGVFLYVLSIKLVFRFRRLPNPALELPLFVALGLAGLAVNCLVMFIAVGSCGLNYLAGKAVASSCTFGINYWLRRNAMFSRFVRGQQPCALAE